MIRLGRIGYRLCLNLVGHLVAYRDDESTVSEGEVWAGTSIYYSFHSSGIGRFCLRIFRSMIKYLSFWTWDLLFEGVYYLKSLECLVVARRSETD